MADPNHRPTPCPRCKAPITGAFKFCPTCAYRLQEPDDTADDGYPTGSRWPAAIAGALFLVLIAAIAILGFKIFFPRENGRPSPVPTPKPARSPLTVEGLEGNLFSETLPRAPATEVLTGVDADGQELWQLVSVERGIMLRFEVTRGMYAEFLADLARRRADGEPWPKGLEFLEGLWRPEPGGDPKTYGDLVVYTNSYLDSWWNMVEARLDELNGSDVSAERPTLLEAPLPREYDLLLLAPPAWIYVNRFDELKFELPPGTENLPVTGVSWYEALAFSQWVNDRLGLKTRLPTEYEWLRAGKSGVPSRLYPWGDEPYYQACNCLQHWTPYEPRLRTVDYRYSDVPGYTRVGEIYAMSGNAREWCMNSEPIRVRKPPSPDDDEKKAEEPFSEDRYRTAPTCGGSYLNGIGGCQLTRGSIRDEQKYDRFDDVGFRLWMKVDR